MIFKILIYTMHNIKTTNRSEISGFKGDKGHGPDNEKT